MKRRKGYYKKNEKGEAMLITTILLLVLVIIVGTTMNVSGMQWDMAYMQKNTSNTYYLAKSGVEKGVDVINKAIQSKMPDFIEEIRTDYLKPLTDLAGVRAEGQNASFYYLNDSELDDSTSKKKMQYISDKLLLEPKVVANILRDKIYDYIDTNHLDKNIEYEVQGDGQTEAVPIQIEIMFKALASVDPLKPQFKIICTAQTSDSSDVKIVEGIIDIEVPENIDNEIHEAYNWLYNPPEILDSAVTCFSDVVITNDAKLTIQGDVRVKGSTRETHTETNGGRLVPVIPEMDEIGGIIASNGGQLEVSSPTDLSTVMQRPATSYYSKKNRVISSKSSYLSSASVASQAEEVNYSTNTGSIYCINNVATTHGWEPKDEADSSSTTKLENYNNDSNTRKKSFISVEGDVIARTLAIFDDFYVGGYNQTPFGSTADRVVTGNQINVDSNVFVDNDVKIDKYVKDSSITIAGSIFGISNGNLGPILKIGSKEYKDPNSSSGIFNRGTGSLIKANGMFVNGQPYIDFEGGLPYALWESIGEPFENVRDYYDIADEALQGTNIYLDAEEFKDIIKRNKIEINTAEYNYAPPGTKISALFGENTTGESKAPSDAILTNQANAQAFFYKGPKPEAGINPPDIRTRNIAIYQDQYDKSSYFTDPKEYYLGTQTLRDKSDMYFKNYYNPELLGSTGFSDHNYKGLRGYMTAKRSVFYGAFKEISSVVMPQMLDFSDSIGLSNVSRSDVIWSYETPIQIVQGGDINIDDYYIYDESDVGRPYPTIIISHSDAVLTITGTPGNSFKGVIISEGNVQIKGEITIEGSLIIGGKDHGGETAVKARDKIMLGKGVGLSLSGDTTKVSIIHNPDMLLKMNVADKVLFRSILDALKITQFKNPPGTDKTNLAAILGPYDTGDI
ncbi:MAG: hypothetical protein K0S30_1848, partial [Clostridia bacterium]|nr:hypothetical protein [Clostridia bacterium]